MNQVLVTGGSGYVGTHLVAALLRRASSEGGQRPVRAVVRSPAREEGLRAAVRRGTATQGSTGDDAGLEVVAADLMSDDGWKDAMAGVDEVYHVASPIPPAQPKDPDELIVPARDGTLRVLRASLDAGVDRIVVTSRRAGSDQVFVWSSSGGSGFEIAPASEEDAARDAEEEPRP